MLDELHDGVYFADTDRRILYWNTAAERLSGYAAADIVGSLCHDNILDHTRLSRMPPVSRTLPSGRGDRDGKTGLQARLFLKYKEGNQIAVEVRVSPVMDKHGRTIGAVEVFRDAGSEYGTGVRLQLRPGACPERPLARDFAHKHPQVLELY